MEYKPHYSNCRVFLKPTKSFKTKFTLKGTKGINVTPVTQEPSLKPLKPAPVA